MGIIKFLEKIHLIPEGAAEASKGTAGVGNRLLTTSKRRRFNIR